jgi:hypothetical protein
MGLNSDINIWKIACEAYNRRWNLRSNSAFALELGKTSEDVGRVGRSQDLPDAN